MKKLLDFDDTEIQKLVDKYRKIPTKTYSEYVISKSNLISGRSEIPALLIHSLEKLFGKEGEFEYCEDGVEYIILRGKYGIDFVVDKIDPNRFYLNSWGERVANVVLDKIGAKFRLSFSRPSRIQYFSISDTYDAIENDHLSKFEEYELDELIYQIQNYENGDYGVVTKFGTYKISIVDGVMNIVEKT